MGKKQKVGKARKDKFYHLAKETGYRARSAFKLIQLNRKFGFLENARVCIDLCAAPGGWCQVAAKFMPVSSLIIGVDLVPIKTIPNVTTFCDDITSDSCRAKLKKQMLTWKADCVLNDGAPNVGQAWVQDAFCQAQLTLSAFKLASEFLKEGGTFVTKIFRSKDYQALLWVFQQFFKKVMATKPQASRNESAEIFVVCQHYLAPDKVDPKFFSYKNVFADVARETNSNQKLNLMNPSKITRKREGYADGASLSLHKTVSARQFIDSDDCLDLLSTAYTIELDDEKIANSIHTTEELKVSLKDIKVLGKGEIKAIIKWHEKIRKEENPEANDVEMEEVEEEEEDEETKIERQILDLETAEKSEKRHKKKKQSKLKEKNLAKVAKGLDVPKGAFGTDEDLTLFNLATIKSKKHLENVEKTEVTADEPKEEQVASEDEKIENFEEDSDSELEMDEGEDVDSASSDDGDSEADEKEEEEEVEDNPLIVKEKKDRIDKTNLWFNKLKDKLLDDDLDEDLEVDAMAQAFGVNKKKEEELKTEEEPALQTKKVQFDLPKDKEKPEDKEKTIAKEETADDSESGSDSESDDEDYRGLRKRKEPTKETEGMEVVPAQKKQKALTAAELALGQQLVTSRKRRNDLMDDAYHRWAWGDEDLPDWFVDEEKKYYKKTLPVTKEQVDEYKQQIKEINARPIKKVAEAKAKAKYKAMKKLKKLSEQADLITDNKDGAQAEQVHKLKQMMKKALPKKQETTYVKAKRMHGQYQKRPPGANGKVKYVDSRMKKDVDGMKRAAAKKKGGSKPKQARGRVGHKPRSR